MKRAQPFKLPRNQGLVLNSRLTQTLLDGAVHASLLNQTTSCLTSMRTIYAVAPASLQWDLIIGHIFPDTSTTGLPVDINLSDPLNLLSMTT